MFTRLFSTAYSKTEKLRLLLTLTIVTVYSYIPYPAITDVLPRNKRLPRIVAAQKPVVKKVIAAGSDRRNAVYYSTQADNLNSFCFC